MFTHLVGQQLDPDVKKYWVTDFCKGLLTAYQIFSLRIIQKSYEYNVDTQRLHICHKQAHNSTKSVVYGRVLDFD